MIICNTCHAKNDDGSPACTTCGEALDILKGKAVYIDTGGPGPASFAPAPPQAEPRPFVPPPPRPNPNPLVSPPMGAMPLMPMGGGGWCQFCHTPFPPVNQKKISTAGWIVFGVLLLMCIPLCWIGLLMTEDQRVCSQCGRRIYNLF